MNLIKLSQSLLESGDTSGTIDNINRYLKKNKQSKEAYLLRAVFIVGN